MTTRKHVLIRYDGKIVMTAPTFYEVKQWLDFYNHYYGEGAYRIETREIIQTD